MNEGKAICKVTENIVLSINDMPIAIGQIFKLSYSSVRRQNTLTHNSEIVQERDFSDPTYNSACVR